MIAGTLPVPACSAGSLDAVRRFRRQETAPTRPTLSRMQNVQHVLVVDRQPRQRRLVQDALERTGEYRVSCAANGDDALSVLDLDRPNLVVLDLMMTGMPGIELAAHATQRGIPIVVTTDQAEMDDRLTRLGWPCVAKPIRIELLLRECRATIPERRATLRTVRSSLARLLTATGEVKDLVARLDLLRARLSETLKASRPLH
jgi:CheY-like chemotaxis protein